MARPMAPPDPPGISLSDIDEFVASQSDLDPNLATVDTIATDAASRLMPGSAFDLNPDSIPTSPEPYPDPLDEIDIEALGQSLRQQLESAYDNNEPLRSHWQHCRDIYNAEPVESTKNYPFEGACKVVVPLAAEYTDQIVARIMRQLYAFDGQLWVARARNRRYEPLAKPVERWLNGAASDLWDQYSVAKPAVTECVKLGTSIIVNSWRSYEYRRFDPNTRQTESRTVAGPSPHWIPLEDFLLPPLYDNPQTSPWVAWRTYLTATDLSAAATGIEPWFNPESVEKVLATVESTDADTSDTRSSRQTHPYSDTANDSDNIGVDTRQFELWTVYFNADFDSDGALEGYNATIEGSTGEVLRITPSPYPTNLRPLIVLRFIQSEGQFYGIGIPEMSEQGQTEVTTIHRERRDNAHLANIRMYKSGPSYQGSDTIRPVSGKVIKVMDPAKDLVEFKLSDSRQVDIYEEEVVTRQLERRIGVNDISQGRLTSPAGRASATTVLALMQEGTQRFDLNTFELRQAFGEQAHQVIEMFQVHGLPEPDAPGSPELYLDNDEATALRQFLRQPDDVRGILACEVTSASSTLNKEVEKQANLQLYGVLTQYSKQATEIALQIADQRMPPEVKAALLRNLQGMDEMLKRVFQSFGQYNLDTALVGDLMQNLFQASLQQQAIAAGNPSTPESSLTPPHPSEYSGNGTAPPPMGEASQSPIQGSSGQGQRFSPLEPGTGTTAYDTGGTNS